MTIYYMTTISNGTRIRKEHNTFSEVVSSVGAGIPVSGNEIWEAPADGPEVKKGDKWLKLPDGWMAYIHKGVPICRDFRTVEESPTDPQPENEFPQSFTLINDETGRRAKFAFVGIVE